jgi:GGDEF domain-containing protein
VDLRNNAAAYAEQVAAGKMTEGQAARANKDYFNMLWERNRKGATPADADTTAGIQPNGANVPAVYDPVAQNNRTAEAPTAKPVVNDSLTTETPVTEANSANNQVAPEMPVYSGAKPVTDPAIIAQLEATTETSGPSAMLPEYNSSAANQPVNLPQGFVLDTPIKSEVISNGKGNQETNSTQGGQAGEQGLLVAPDDSDPLQKVSDVPSAQTGTVPSEMAAPVNAQTAPVKPFVSQPEQTPSLRPENQPETADSQPDTQNQPAEYQAMSLKPSVDPKTLKTPADVFQAFRDGKLTYGDYSTTYDSAKHETSLQKALEDPAISSVKIRKDTIEVRTPDTRNENGEVVPGELIGRFKLADKTQAAADTSAELLGTGYPRDRVVSEGRAMLKRLYSGDKEFAKNPVFQVVQETPDHAMMLQFKVGRRTYNIRPEVLNIDQYGDLPSGNTILKPGDTIRLSPGYLENKQPQIYLVPKGVEKSGGGNIFADTGGYDIKAETGQNHISKSETDMRTTVADMVQRNDVDGLTKMIFHDSLTNTYNAAGWSMAVKNMPAGSAVVSMDVSGLKWINDNFGHVAGDALLRIIADAAEPLGIKIFRKGGDEFATIFDNMAIAETQITKLSDAVSKKVIDVISKDGASLSYTGWRLDYGIDTNFDAADAKLTASREQQVLDGTRNPPHQRGERPRGIIETVHGGTRPDSVVQSKRVTPSKDHADTGGYNLNPPGPQNAPFAQQKVSALQLPEIVEIAKNLMGGKYPHILRKLNKRGALGVFKTGTGSIDLRADLAKTPGLLERVLAHEIGHLVDWLPDHDIKRGNILGRIASLKKYMGSLLAEYEGAPGATLSKKDRARLRSEAERELKANERPDETVIETITREVPQWKYTGIDPEMIKAIWNDTTAREKYPKLYRALAEMSDSEKKAVLVQAMNGLVHDRLSHMGERVQVGTRTVTEEVSRTIPGIHATPEEISKRYAELVQEEISKRNLYKLETISQELKDLTLHWKPFQPGNDPGYTAYRFSSAELYADAFSALLNDPAMVRKIAPTFEKAFMSYLNRKPEVSKVYYDIQQRLNNSDEIMQHRQENIRSMFDRGEAIKKESERKPLADIMHSLYKDLIDKNADINLKVKAVKKSGKIVEDADNPAYWVETLPYISGEVYSHLHEIDSLMLEPMKLDGLTIDDLGEYMLLKRITSDRAELANPLGHTAETAAAGLKHLEQQLGPEKWQALADYVEKYKGIRERNVIDVVDQAEMWPDDLMQHVRDNTDYATWEVQKFIEAKYGRSVSAQIFKQVGTLQEIRNPFIATVMKDAALIRAANVKIVKQKVTDFLKEHFPDEIRSADTRWNGKTHEPVEPSDPDQGMIMFPHKGEVQALYVPKGIAETFAHSPYEASAILKAWQIMNIPLRAVLVNHNPLWMVANVPRDFIETWKNTPGLSIFTLLKYYGKAAPEAWADVFNGKMSPEIQGMFKNKMLVTDRQFTNIDESPDNELDRMLQQFGKSQVQYRNKVIKPFMMLWDALGNMGKFTERIGKLAGHKYITENTDMTPEKTGHMVRSRVGTPDVHRTGRLHAITNNIFLFSNVAKEGWRSSWESAKESKAEYAWKTAAYNIIPKLMMAAAAAGAFGSGIKKIMDSASNYDKTNYNVIPLGFDSKGKGVYFRVPQDYTGTMVGGVLWNAMQGNITGSKSVLSYASEQSPYSLNPYLSAATDIVQIMRGLNPYDDYRGKLVIPDQIFKANDHRKWLEFGKHMSNSLGGSSIYQFSGDGPEKVQSEFEKVLKYPGANVLGRFLKVSDQGEREQLRDVTQQVAEKEARRSLDVREAIIEDIDKQNGQPTVSDKVKLYRQLIDEKKLDNDTKFSEFRPRYDRYAGKVQNNAKIDAIIDAAGVKEKSALLQSYEKTMPAAEYQKIVEQLTVEGYIKRGVFKEMALEKAGVK